MADEFQSFSDMLRKGLGDRLDARADSFVDMVADDVVMEFPYAPREWSPGWRAKQPSQGICETSAACSLSIA